jgi:DNA-binding transcriptional MerR regulator
MREFDPERDFLTISEFASIVGMTVDTLRHYDRKGVFLPAKVETKGTNECRYYSPTQITSIKMIKVLAEIGVKLDVIKELAQNRTPEAMFKLLNKHGNIVADEMRFLHSVSLVISTFTSLLTEGLGATEYDLTVSEVNERKIILGKKNDFSDSISFYSEYVRFCNSELEPKLNLSYPVGGYFDSMEKFLHEPSQPSRFFSLDPDGNDVKQAGIYLIGYNRGYYGDTGDLPERMSEFARKNGLVFSGSVYNTYLFDEMSITKPTEYLLQVSASVTETKRVQSRRPVGRN